VAKVELTDNQRDELITVFKSQLPAIEKTEFIVSFEQLSEKVNPVFITQNEFMRRMKEMSALQGGMMSFYGEMPDSYSLVVNTAHPLVKQILNDEEVSLEAEISPVKAEISATDAKHKTLKDAHKDKKPEEIPSEEKEELEKLQSELSTLKEKKETILSNYASGNKQVRQLIDLALLANNMLKGEALANFVKRSVELM
jgi:molecular chaperone HtpG